MTPVLTEEELRLRLDLLKGGKSGRNDQRAIGLVPFALLTFTLYRGGRVTPGVRPGHGGGSVVGGEVVRTGRFGR